ncbi:MAG TPA: TonB-dependent receptor [Kofleriaceae bacterium]|nr:TonB-dependent receptor [Kofleriaceae bacterium]
MSAHHVPRLVLVGPLLAGLLLAGARAHAQPAPAPPDTQPQPVDIEVPSVVVDTSGEGQEQGADTQLDLANVVQSAAKGVTTVQEAPAIVTVITSDDLRQRQFVEITQALDTVPGYMRNGIVHSQFPMATVRGTVQAVQFLQDGTSLFDPFLNIPTLYRLQPIETIKRIETITGPGGVLWGANSFLGIVNVITKDAEDVDGVEMGGQLGDGNGDRSNARVYAMAGMPDLLGGKAKLFLHGSFETYEGPGFEMPLHMFSGPLPQPNATDIYGPLTRAEPPRSYLFNFLAKLTLGNFQLRVQLPYVERHTPLGFPGFVVLKDLPEDARCAGANPLDTSDSCIDPDKRSRDNQVDFLDRYVVGEYRTRFAGGKAGLSLKGYGIQFVRNFPQVGILAPTPVLLEGGLAFRFNATSYRVGGAAEGDADLPHDLRLQYGAEAFSEFALNDVQRSRQGDGIEASFIGPYLLARLPLPCPLTIDNATTHNVVPIEGCPLTFAFPSSRTVLGAYLNPQWRPTKKVILDAGARLQIAPEALGKQSYPLTPLFSGALVWNFAPSYHLKLNLAQGYRPPVFNNTNSNGEAVQIDGRPDLAVETSNAAQAEINGRVFKGERRIRELSFRVDYSYTKLKNLIQVVSGRYENTADRGIHSAEALARLYVQGGHQLELGYTFLRINMADKGIHRSMPEHMFHLTGVFNLVDGKLSAVTDLRVVGAMEDANRLIEYRGYHYSDGTDGYPAGTILDPSGNPGEFNSGPSQLVFDRLPPAADLTVGLAYTPTPKLTVRATVFNAFDARYYQPDAFGDYEPRLEFLPNPWEDVRGYLSAELAY